MSQSLPVAGGKDRTAERAAPLIAAAVGPADQVLAGARV
jgi:hypothetical protein